MSTTDRTASPPGGYVAGCAQLAAKHWLGFITWTELDAGRKRYRVNVRLGSRGGPFPHWAQVFDITTPIEQATEEVARMAWEYYTATGYRPAGSTGLAERDLAWAPSSQIVDLDAEDAEQKARWFEEGKRRMRKEAERRDLSLRDRRG